MAEDFISKVPIDEYEIEIKKISKFELYKEILFYKQLFYIKGITRISDGSIMHGPIKVNSDSIIFDVGENETKTLYVAPSAKACAYNGFEISTKFKKQNDFVISFYNPNYQKLLRDNIFKDDFHEQGIIDKIMYYMN
jgi:hypothetical protein